MSLQTAYLVMQENCEIGIGDTVRVLRAAKTREMGWGNSWTEDMDSSVKKEFIVLENNGAHGLKLDDDEYKLDYPFFVLEKIKSAPQRKKIEFDGKEVEVSAETFEKRKEFFTSL